MGRLKEFFDGCKEGNIGIVTDFIASQKQMNPILQRLVGNLDSLDDGKRTGLLLAAMHNHIICLRALTDAGANIYARDESGCTVLHYATWNANTEMVAYLLTEDAKQKSQLAGVAAYASPSNPTGSDGATALHIACKSNLTDIAACLLRFNASPLVPNTAGQTPFDVACAGGHTETVAALLPACRGFLYDVVSFTGCSPLEEAARGGHTAVVQLLLDAGFRVNARSGSLSANSSVGGTALHAASAGLRHATVQLLLAAGANPAARDSSGRTVLDLLRSLGSPEHLRLAEELACRADIAPDSVSVGSGGVFASAGAPLERRPPPARPPPPRSVVSAVQLADSDSCGEGRASPRPAPRRSRHQELALSVTSQVAAQTPPVAKRRSALVATMQQQDQPKPPSAKPRQRATIMLLTPTSGQAPPKRPPAPLHLRGLTFNEEQQQKVGDSDKPADNGSGPSDTGGEVPCDLLISIDEDQQTLASSSAAPSAFVGDVDLLTEFAEARPVPTAYRESTFGGDLLDLGLPDCPDPTWEPISFEPMSQSIGTEEQLRPECQPIYDEPILHPQPMNSDSEQELIEDKSVSDSHKNTEELNSDSQPITGEQKSESQPIADDAATQLITVEPKSDSQPITEEPKSDSQPITEEPKSDSQPITEEPKSDSQPITKEPKSDSQPITEEPKSDSQPITEEPKSDSQPIQEYPSCHSQLPVLTDEQPILDQSDRTSGALIVIDQDIVQDSEPHESQPANVQKLDTLRSQSPVPTPRGSRIRPTAASASSSSTVCGLQLDLMASDGPILRPSPDSSPLTDWQPLSLLAGGTARQSADSELDEQSRQRAANSVSVVCNPLMQECDRLGARVELWPQPVVIGETSFYM